MQPGDYLKKGMDILADTLLAAGFHATPVEEEAGSGGAFATARFVRDNRVLELHFRHSLGMVRYHVGPHQASHESYMRVVAPRGDNSYPGFSSEPLAAFAGLAADLVRFASDFLIGDAAALKEAAAAESAAEQEQNHRSMIEYTGDGRQRQAARDEFRRGEYARVVSLLSDLNYPDDLSAVERRMLEIARQRA